MNESASVKRTTSRVVIATVAALGLALVTVQPANATYYASGFGTGLTYINNYSYNCRLAASDESCRLELELDGNSR